MTTSQPPVFDKEKAKRAWLKLLKGVVLLALVGAAGYYVFEVVLSPVDTPMQAAVKAADVEAVRRELGSADSPDAYDRAYSAYQPALERLSPSNPATTEILKLVLARLSQWPVASGSAKPADHTFTLRDNRSRRARSTDRPSSAVELAARQWSADGVRVLLDYGLTIRSVGVSGALVTAASNGAEPIVTLLLDAGADVNGRDKHNDTPLAMARRGDNPGMVKLLVARGAREN